MIVFLESLRLAFSSLRANPLRAALTVLGIMIGIASVVALTAIGTGSQKSVESRFTSFGTDTITVRSSGFFSSGNPLTLSDLAAVRKTPGVKRVVYTVDSDATVTYGGTSVQASISGTSPEIQGINGLQVAAGSFFSTFAFKHDLPLAVVGYNVATELSMSAARAVGQTIRIGGRDYVIAGVLKETGGVGFASSDDTVIVPRGAIEGRLVAFHPDISTMRVQAQHAALATYSSAVESTLRAQHNLTSSDQADFQIVNASSIASAVSSTQATLTKLMAAIAAISLLVGGIGIANVMLVTVRERTREIGVRRAIGATRNNIVVQFLVDAVIISIIGGVLGIGAGVGGAYIGGSVMNVTPVLSWLYMVLALAVAAVVGVVAGLGPAVQASSVEPTMALRYE
jgi:putative ABC transport system permease protein